MTFGTWQIRPKPNTNAFQATRKYRARSDGFVVAVVTGRGDPATVLGQTDSGPATTVRASATVASPPIGSQTDSFSMPVRKGDYWRVGKGPGYRASTRVVIYFLPVDAS